MLPLKDLAGLMAFPLHLDELQTIYTIEALFPHTENVGRGRLSGMIGSPI